MKRLLSMGQREDRALVFAMAFCIVAFVARTPALARQAHLEQSELNMLLAGALLGIVIILPLILYVIAWASHLLARLLGGDVEVVKTVPGVGTCFRVTVATGSLEGIRLIDASTAETEAWADGPGDAGDGRPDRQAPPLAHVAGR